MDVMAWLLDSDPSIRWQVMRDLTGVPAEAVAAERAKVATEGFGSRLLGHGRSIGQGRTSCPNRGFGGGSSRRRHKKASPRCRRSKRAR